MLASGWSTPPNCRGQLRAACPPTSTPCGAPRELTPPCRCCPTLPRHPTTMSTKAAKPAPAHPAYVTMIAAAIKALKDRTGSSAPAIAKYLGANYKLPAGFEKTLTTQLKRLAAAGKLVRVKASFKLSEELKKPAKVRGRCRQGRRPGGDSQRLTGGGVAAAAAGAHLPAHCPVWHAHWLQKPAVKKVVKKAVKKTPAKKKVQGWWRRWPRRFGPRLPSTAASAHAPSALPLPPPACCCQGHQGEEDDCHQEGVSGGEDGGGAAPTANCRCLCSHVPLCPTCHCPDRRQEGHQAQGDRHQGQEGAGTSGSAQGSPVSIATQRQAGLTRPSPHLLPLPPRSPTPPRRPPPRRPPSPLPRSLPPRRRRPSPRPSPPPRSEAAALLGLRSPLRRP